MVEHKQRSNEYLSPSERSHRSVPVGPHSDRVFVKPFLHPDANLCRAVLKERFSYKMQTGRELH